MPRPPLLRAIRSCTTPTNHLLSKEQHLACSGLLKHEETRQLVKVDAPAMPLIKEVVGGCDALVWSEDDTHCVLEGASLKVMRAKAKELLTAHDEAFLAHGERERAEALETEVMEALEEEGVYKAQNLLQTKRDQLDPATIQKLECKYGPTLQKTFTVHVEWGKEPLRFPASAQTATELQDALRAVFGSRAKLVRTSQRTSLTETQLKQRAGEIGELWLKAPGDGGINGFHDSPLPPNPPPPLLLADLAPDLHSLIKTQIVLSLAERGSVLDLHSLTCSCKAFRVPVSDDVWWELFSHALLKPGVDDATQRPKNIALHSLVLAFEYMTRLHCKQGGTGEWLADAMKAGGYDGPLGLNLEARLIHMGSTVRGSGQDRALQLALPVIPVAYEKLAPSVRTHVDPTKQAPLPTSGSGPFSALERLTLLGCQLLALFEFIHEPPADCVLVALVGFNGQLWISRIDGRAGDDYVVILLATSAERVVRHSREVSFTSNEPTFYAFAREDKVLTNPCGYSTLGAQVNSGFAMTPFGDTIGIPELTDWHPRVWDIQMVLDERDDLWMGFPGELFQQILTVPNTNPKTLEKDGFFYLMADDNRYGSFICTRPASRTLYRYLRYVLKFGGRPIVVQQLEYQDLSTAQQWKGGGGGGDDDDDQGDDDQGDGDDASTVPDAEAGELIEELESPDDAPAGAAAGPLHEPDPDEGEFEGACNVCGGSHMYCRLCSVSYCIMCEEAGCEGEPYGVHDSSQSADGRHDLESE